MADKAKFLEQLQAWHQQDKFQEIIDAIEALPQEERGYELTCQLARAYNNRAVLGKEGHPDLEQALALLDSVASQGAEDPLWFFRRGYALYYLDREADALPCFQEAARLDPADSDAPWFIERCQEILAEPVTYSREEMEALDAHINNYFGECQNVLHEKVSRDIHVDIYLIPPKGARNYLTLVTMGMGAVIMNVPEELAEYKLERAELVIALPPDWPMELETWEQEENYWPLRLLKSTAHLPLEHDTWLGWGHTIALAEGQTYADNTDLCGSVLVSPQRTPEEACCCRLPDGSEVNFYQLIPLYKDEIDFKVRHNTEALLEHMRGVSFVVDIKRPHADLTEAPPLPDMPGNFLMDDAAWHLEIIREKQLPVEELCAYNHLAVYLRWCLEHNLLSAEFMAKFGSQAQESLADLRPLLRDKLGGQLDTSLFGEEGCAFARHYYGAGDDPYFPSDVDNFARRYFGDKRYASPELQQEAYLFLPFGEDCYQALSAVISRRFADWQEK